jgi:hypothetical protein
MTKSFLIYIQREGQLKRLRAGRPRSFFARPGKEQKGYNSARQIRREEDFVAARSLS